MSGRPEPSFSGLPGDPGRAPDLGPSLHLLCHSGVALRPEPAHPHLLKALLGILEPMLPVLSCQPEALPAEHQLG